MIIKINDKPLDFSLDNESTLGDVFNSLEQWLSNSGHRLSEIFIDGQAVSAGMLEEVFKKEVKSINNLDIHTNAIAELAAASLQSLLIDIDEYEKLKFDEKAKFFDNWKERAQAVFIMEEMPDLYSYFKSTFLNGEVAAATLRSVTEEIQREVNEPLKELVKIEPVLNEICAKLINLPLDIQTGKDLIAAQSLQLFTAITEKLIRLFYQLSTQGYLVQIEEAKKIAEDFGKFRDILSQLLESYEKHDIIIVGDLAEYEAAPKLKELYTNILRNCQEEAKTQDKE
jgi:ribosome-associated toxin RatA of RatAB toxin-antitoxin module